MTEETDYPRPHRTIRERAEERVAASPTDVASMSIEDVQELVNELQVRQTELEIENEQLREARNEQNEERYRRLANAEIDYTFMVRLENGSAVETIHGPNCEAITGYTPAEFDANSLLWISIVPEADRASVEHHIRQTMAGEKPPPLEHRICRKDGTIHWVARVTSPRLDADGRLVSYDGLLRDITVRKEADIALRALNIDLDQALTDRTAELQDSLDQVALFRKAIAHLGEGVVITSDQLEWPGPQIVFVNEAMCRITGYTADELIGQTPRMLQGENTGRDKLDRLKARLSAGHPVATELTNYRKDGTSYDAEMLITPLFNAEGHRTNFVSIHRDITERKKAEQELHNREERLRTVLNTAADAIINIDQRGMITAVNPATRQMFGYTQDELVGRNVSILMTPPYCDEHDGYIARYLKTGEARIIGIGRELTGRRKDGSIFPIDLAVSEVDHLGLFTGIVRDISDRLRLEQEILDIADREQRRIGQDLHDGVGQELTGLGISADTLAKSLARDPGGIPASHVEMAERLTGRLKQATTAVRKLARGLIPVEVDARGLQSSLSQLAGRLDELPDVSAVFECPQPVPVENNTTATHLYRIAQEAAANAVRHAAPERIVIRLEKTDAMAILTVSDDGTGIDLDQKSAGLGLRIMQYRADQIGARMRIHRGASAGTVVTCYCPLDPTSSSQPAGS